MGRHAPIAAALLLGLTSPAFATMPPRSGGLPIEVSQACKQGLLLSSQRSAGPSLRTSAATEWRIPVILFSFSDDTLSFDPPDFDLALFDTTQSTSTGSLFDYFRWVSGGRMSVHGEVVATVILPHSRSFYGHGSYGLAAFATPNNTYGAIHDALVAGDPLVNWSDYDLDHDGQVDMAWFVHAGRGGEAGGDPNALWTMTTRLSVGWRNGVAFTTSDSIPGSSGFIRVDRCSCLPELSALVSGAHSEIGAFCHEFGHALGLPDLYDTSPGAVNVGPGNWSLMATGANGTDGMSPSYPSHLGAWPALYLGWVEASRPTEDALLTIAPVETSHRIVEFWFQGESNPEHFLIENRQAEGFDRNLPAEGLIVYHVDDAVIAARLASNTINAGPSPGLRLVEADGDFDLVAGRNHGDVGDPFPGTTARTALDDSGQPNTRSFSGAATNIALGDIHSLGDDIALFVRVRAPGWLSPVDHTEPGRTPLASVGPAVNAVADSDGTLYSVAAESIGGTSRIVLRSRIGSVWQPSFIVNSSSASAIEPSIAAQPNGDLTLVWSDFRGGRWRVFGRSRNAGIWSDDQLVVQLPGESRSPSLAGGGSGTLYLACINTGQSERAIWFMPFTQLSMAGIPVRVTSPEDHPTPPAVASGMKGHAYVSWSDSTSMPVAPRFAVYRPDSGLSESLPLAPSSVFSQTSVRSVVDGEGVWHSVWVEETPGAQRLHYQSRDFGSANWLRDTVLVSEADSILNPVLAVDLAGGLHVGYERVRDGSHSFRYRQRPHTGSWDFLSTDVTRPFEGDATPLALVPVSPTDVTALYVLGSAMGPRFMDRRRLHGGEVVSIPAQSSVPAAGSLTLGPNPLPLGHALELSWAPRGAFHAGWVDVFDITGRRVAVVPLRRVQTGIEQGRLDAMATARLPGGVYLACVRGEPTAHSRFVVLR